MRFGVAFLVAAAASFLVTAGLRHAPTWVPPEPSAALATVAPFQPPPLNLPAESTCTEAWSGLTSRDAWTPDVVEARLRSRAAAHADVELVEVDCDEDPCVAWLLWAEGCTDPALAYRWWSIEAAPASALWTTSRSYALALPGAPEATLQAVSVAPPGPGVALATRERVQARIGARLPGLRERLGGAN